MSVHKVESFFEELLVTFMKPRCSLLKDLPLYLVLNQMYPGHVFMLCYSNILL